MNGEAHAIQIWHDAFVEIVEGGIDPADAAASMLSCAGLLLAQHGGTAAARLALTAGLDFLLRREQSAAVPGPVH